MLLLQKQSQTTSFTTCKVYNVFDSLQLNRQKMKKFTHNKIFYLLLLIGLTINYAPSAVNADTIFQQQNVIVDQAVINEIITKGTASYWIEFKNDTDLSQAYFLDWNERGWFVYDTLKKQADQTQAQVQKYLTNSNVEYKSFWINNSILVTSSTNSVLSDLLKFTGVEKIESRKSYILYEPEKSAATTDNDLNAIEPNIAHVKAPEAWALGYDGTGLVVANIDTGVRYSHTTLVGSYRGNNGDGTFDHNYNWYNPYQPLDNVPRDGHGHGTHTMGIMVGDDGGANQIGIAPGAEWIACAGCPDGICPDAALLGCGEFIAAPTDLTGNNANPDLRPNAVNNSWGDCGTAYDPWYEGPINAWLAAGIYPIFSNGNASNCGYSAPPGLNTVGNPARSGNVTGVGSTGQQNGLYASHSNWGPTDDPDTINPVTGFEMMKPQVLAPGVYIRSSLSGSDTHYGYLSGTSMSAPHVTGLVALIWQAAPCLIGDYATTETIIEETAVDMIYDDGSSLTPTNFPNFATGWGEIDALAAVNFASGLCSMGALQGTVTTDGYLPIEGAKIFADNGAGYSKSIYSAANGIYSTDLLEGNYTLTTSKYGYQSQTFTNIWVFKSLTTTQDFVIYPVEFKLIFPMIIK